MTTIFAMVQVRAQLAELVNRVVVGGERIVITRRGKQMAALVSVEDLYRLEMMEPGEPGSAGKTAHPIMRAFGGWAERTELDELVAEIYADRTRRVAS